jgi:hypothetical protein
MQASPHGDAPLQQERTNLIDDAGTLTDQSIADAVRRLKIELIGRHRALDSLGDGFRISEVILLSLRKGAHVFRRHQAGVVAKHLESATEMMHPDAGLHTNQARRQVGEPSFGPRDHFCRSTMAPRGS